MDKGVQKAFEEQHDDEKMLVLSNNHPVVLRKPLLISLVIITVTLLPFSINPFALWLLWVALAGLILSLFIMFYAWIGWHFSSYVITNQRLLQITQKGFFKRSVNEIGLDKIQNVNYSVDGFQQHLLHFGDVTIQTYAADMQLRSINHPARFHKQLTEAIKVYAGKKGITPIEGKD